ncbi:putative cyclase [Cynara cardunculus var. scolymus]|uniref:Putative cyclase n=1 Tax=Cynara cardunculus var. scolymus TaxID=59895 RepID=A0A118JUE7_CYNCS|nr:putative cyclase [Cynara cardunculus var. scolymus]
MVLLNAAVAILFTTLITFSAAAASFVADDAYPSPHIASMTSCDLDDLSPIRREEYDEGRIIDITHRYRSDMPSWESDDGLGQFLWLPGSMKNGSLANNSEMKLPAHTGTHVDAPGHVYDHYFDAGFDVDTLDLHVLNENMMARKMSPLLTFLMLVLPSMVLSSQDSAYPPSYGADKDSCGGSSCKLIPPRREVYGNGKIYDITHTITMKNPSGLSNEAFDPYLQLFASMKNGSDYNFSLIKLPAHSGTHVDAPGHFYENYYEAGFDVDSLDLEVLNDLLKTSKLSSLENMMARKMSPQLILLILVLPCMVRSSQDSAYPPPYGVDKDSCGGSAGLIPPRREVYGNGRIYDITHRITSETRSWDSDEGIGLYLTLYASMKNGSDCNFSLIKLPAHSGTHVDAPGHVFENYYEAGFDIDSLDLEILNGPALLVDVPRDKNITAEVMKSLNIPRGVKRVLFRTLNTDRRLMWQKPFDTSYVGFMKDGAQWLKDNTDIKLVGTDYLSVAAFDDLIPAHLVFLESREIILVEGLKLEDVKAGIYNVHCLPLRLLGAEGSPIRCILIK